MKQQIKHWLGHVLYECEVPEDVESGMAVRWALEKAVSDRIDLSGAVLRCADLSDAVLSGAVLRYAVLSGADGNTLRATPEEAVANLDKVRAIILDNSERLEMGHWHGTSDWREKTCAEETLCGTTHCLAGWLQVCSTKPEIRQMDAELAGILTAPVAAKMFFKTSAEVLPWLEGREYVKELGLTEAPPSDLPSGVLKT
jgi:hypothetical protein